VIADHYRRCNDRRWWRSRPQTRAASPRLPPGSGGHAGREGPGHRRGRERPPARGGGGGGGGRYSSGGEGCRGKNRAWRDGEADVAAPEEIYKHLWLSVDSPWGFMIILIQF
jgi:hypothetical protein